MKVCSSCGKKKRLDDFSNNGSVKLSTGEVKTYKKSHCKQCKAQSVKFTRRDRKEYYLSAKWNHMKQRCEERHKDKGFSYPSKEEFIRWSLARDDFNQQFDKWVRSGFDMQESASIDRIDNSKGYEFDNMQFISFRENSVKDRGKKVALKKGNSCYEFNSLIDAAKACQISYDSAHRLAAGKVDSVKGWELA